MSLHSARLAVVLSAVFLLLAATRGPAQQNTRISRIEEQMASTKKMMAEATNETERAQWSQRLSLLEQDRQSVERRVALEEKERTMAAEQRHRSVTALQEALQAIDVNVTAPTEESKRLNLTIRQLRADRAASEDLRIELQKEPVDNAERISDTDLRLRNQDEDIRARQLERDAADLRVRLGGEGARIDDVLRKMPINPNPTIRIILEKRRVLAAEQKLFDDMTTSLGVLKQQRDEVAAAVALTKDKLSHSDQEIGILEKKKQVMGAQSESRHMLYVTTTEKKLLSVRLESEKQQLAALDDTRDVATQIHDLYDKELAFLSEDLSALMSHYWKLLLIPVTLIATVILVDFLISRLVLPFVYRRDSLFVARRLGQYVVALLIIVILAIFFLEDLRQIATVLGIASAAIVIALQDMFSAFAGWFVIVVGRKFLVGDRVEIDGHQGDIIDIQLLRTTLLEVDNWLGVDEATGRVIIIPNNFVFKTQVFNYAHVHPFIWNKLDVTVTYETPAAEAHALLLKILSEETKLELSEAAGGAKAMERRYGVSDTEYKPKMFSFIADSGITYRLIYVSHYKKGSSTRNKLNERIIAEFAKDPRMQFAYPTQRHIPTPEQGALRVKIEGSTGKS